MRGLIVAAIAGIFVLSAAADDLPRRVWHGLGLKPAAGGLEITAVAPGGTGEAAGLKAGDILTAIAGQPVRAVQDPTTGTLRTLPSGAEVGYALLREGKPVALAAPARARALEQPAKTLTVDYGAVAFRGGRQRTLVTRPTAINGRAPAVMILQGYVCDSIIDLPDGAMYRRVAEQFAAAGFVVMRMDKPGVGDGVGPVACADMDLKTEAAAYAAALRALKARTDVDPNRVFIFGHSLGGNAAPLVADEVPVAGIATFGSNITPWFEYLLQVFRIQLTRTEDDLPKLEREMRQMHRLLYGLLVEQKTPQEMAARDPQFGPLMKDMLSWDGGRRMLTRDISTLWDLSAIDLTTLWAKAAKPTLAIFGEADTAALSGEGSLAVARTVNGANPGAGRYCVAAGVNHAFSQVGSMEAEFAAMRRSDYHQTIAANYGPAVIAETIEWMKGVLGQPRAEIAGVSCRIP